MAYVAINSHLPPSNYAVNAFMNSGLLDATGKKVAWIGTVSWADKTVASRAIRNVTILPGALTTAGGSGLTLSLQDVDLANGPIYRPDGTQDQTVSFLASAMTANTPYTTANLSADRTVSLNALVAVVLEFDGGGRLGSDLVNMLYPTAHLFERGMVLFNGTTWSSLGPNTCVFTFADGAVGILEPGQPHNNNTVQINYNSNTATDEHALRFTPAYTCKIDGLWASVAPSSGAADIDIVLSDTAGAIVTASIDANTTRSSNPALLMAPIAETTLSGGTTYYVSVKPTTTTNVGLRVMDVASSAVRACLPEAASCGYSSRADGGAWTNNDLRIPLIGVRLSAIDTGAGAGLAAPILGGYVG